MAALINLAPKAHPPAQPAKTTLFAGGNAAGAPRELFRAN